MKILVNHKKIIVIKTIINSSLELNKIIDQYMHLFFCKYPTDRIQSACVEHESKKNVYKKFTLYVNS